MTSARMSDFNKPPIYLQPNHLADYLSSQQEYCLFLDIDGTLADFTLNPKDSFIPQNTLTLLQQIQHHDGHIAVITGRSLAEAKQMLAPLQLPIAATHGLEISFDNPKDNNDSPGSEPSITSPVDSGELNAIKQALFQASQPYDNFTIEEKPYSVALHYRQNPALADVAHTIVSELIEDQPKWGLKPGKYVWEVVPKGVNKGTAILTLLEKIQSSSDCNGELYPIFIGDDLTDEAGFMAVQGEENTLESSKGNQHRAIKGMGIKVGREPTCAHYYVYTVYEVTVLLESILNFYKQRAFAASDLIDANPPLFKQ
jgi:trehalose 6-phosphate phosphatase